MNHGTTNLTLLILALTAWPATAAQASADSGCALLMLRRSHGDLTVERIAVGLGQQHHLTIGPDSEWITVLHPLGPGKSADLVQASRGPTQLQAHCTDGGMAISLLRPGTAPRALPLVPRRDLAAWDLRISVHRSGAASRVFLVERGREVRPGSGPPLDLFGGRIPLGPGDYSITLETSLASAPQMVEGSAQLHFDGEHHFVWGSARGGREGWFVVDLAAGRTVLAHHALPPATALSRPTATEYSEHGERAVDAAMVGLGGTVGGWLGQATVADLQFGSISFDVATVSVLETLPTIGGRQIAGILGVDQLRRAAGLRLGYRDRGSLELGPLPAAAAPGVIPFALVDQHLFVEATIGGRPLTLVVDTGAKVSLLEPTLAADLALTVDKANSVEVRGLAAEAVAAHRVMVPELIVAETTLGDATFYAAPLPVLSAWGLAPNTAILGNNILRRFAAIEVDFDRRQLRLVAP
jgi:hypothetical protein